MARARPLDRDQVSQSPAAIGGEKRVNPGVGFDVARRVVERTIRPRRQSVFEGKLDERRAIQLQPLAAARQQRQRIAVADQAGFDTQRQQRLRQKQGARRTVGFGRDAVVHHGAKAGDNCDALCAPGQFERRVAQRAGIERRLCAAKAGQSAPGRIAMHDRLQLSPGHGSILGRDSAIVARRCLRLEIGWEARSHDGGLASRGRFVKMSAIREIGKRRGKRSSNFLPIGSHLPAATCRQWWPSDPSIRVGPGRHPFLAGLFCRLTGCAGTLHRREDNLSDRVRPKRRRRVG